MNITIVIGIGIVIIIGISIFFYLSNRNRTITNTAMFAMLIAYIITIVSVSLTVYEKYKNTYLSRLELSSNNYKKNHELQKLLMENYPYSYYLMEETRSFQPDYVAKNYDEREQFMMNQLCEMIFRYLEYLYLIQSHRCPSYYNRQSDKHDSDIQELYNRHLSKWLQSSTIERYWKTHSLEYLPDFSNSVNDFLMKRSKTNI